jgi:hypothetical protein
MSSPHSNPTVYAAAHILSTAIVSTLHFVSEEMRAVITNACVERFARSSVNARWILPSLLWAVYLNLFCIGCTYWIICRHLPTTYRISERHQATGAEMEQRYYRIISQHRYIQLARTSVFPTLAYGVAVGYGQVGYDFGLGVVFGVLTWVCGLSAIFTYILLVHTVERALLELDDIHQTYFSRGPIVPLSLPSVNITCFICHEDVCNKQSSAGHHPSGHVISKLNLSECKVYHQLCLVQWWRNDRTKIGQCPECTTSPRWSRLVFTATSP